MVAIGDLRRKLGSEEGFGVVEMVTAAVLVAVGLVGAVAAFDGAKHTTYTAQRHEQAIAYAEREIELLKAQPFNHLELDSRPAPNGTPDDANNPSDPLAYLRDTNADGAADEFRILADYNDAAGGAPAGNPEAEPLVVDSNLGDDDVSVVPVETGVVVGPTTVDLPAGAQETTATVYRLVTASCNLLGTETAECPGDPDSKRLTVAVLLDDVGPDVGPHKPVYVSSVVTRDTPEEP